jgi:hypothetical protein
MHMEIGIVVAAKSKKDARVVAECVDLTSKYDYAQHYGIPVLLDSQEGKARINKYMGYNKENFLYHLATLKNALSICTVDQLFELETYPGSDYGTATFRFACHHIGQRGGSNCWLYDEDGAELSYPAKLKEYIKQFPKRKKGVLFYVVPVNVHY